tara:strand:+ start:4700 stop:5488 length:789 start_codon:yes stop_codon:yes gene_type:complete
VTDETIENYTDKVCPDFTGKKAFIANGAMRGMVAAMFAACGFTRADTVEDADIIVFTGGSDVSPALYGQTAISGTYFNRDRDNLEVEIFTRAKELGKPMFGICRGMQFLHVMAGGALWQDVTGHAGPDHFMVDIEEGVRLKVTSLHHQMVQVSDKINMQLIGVCEDTITKKFEDENILMHTGALSNNARESTATLETEAAFYPDINALAVQGHPECGSDEYKSWTMNKIKDRFFDEADPEDYELEYEVITVNAEGDSKCAES